jgi:hypothetical protein
MQKLSQVVDDTSDRFTRAREAGNGFFGSIAVAQIMGTAEALGFIDQGAANIGRRLTDAEKELAKLQERFAQRGGYYLATEVAKAEELVKKLREAKEAQDDLKAERGTSQSSQFGEASAAIQALATKGLEAQKKATEALTAARNQALGVNTSWLKSINDLYAAFQAGYIKENEYVQTVKALTAETYKAAAAHKAHEAAMDSATKKFFELTKAGHEWARGLEVNNATLAREAELGRQLTEGEKQQIELTTKLATGQLVMNAATEKGARAAIDYGQALRTQVDWQRQSADENAKSFDSLEAETIALEQRAIAMRLGNDQQLLSAAAVREVEAAQLRAAAAEKERRAVLMDLVDPAIAQEYRRQAAALRDQATQSARAANIEAAKDSTAAWNRMAEDAGQALSNALMQGGRNAGEQLKAYFRTLVLRPIIDAVVSPITGALAALLSGGTASGGGGNGTAAALAGANNASTLYSLYQAGTGYSGGVNALAGYFGAGTTAGASGVSLAYANAVGAAGGDSLGALIAANNSWSGVAAGNSLGSAAAGEGVAAGSGAEAGSAGASAGASAWTLYAAAFIAAWMGSKSAWEKGFNNDNLTGAFKYSPESTFTDLLKLGGFSDRSANIWGGGAVYTQLFGRADPRVTGQGIQGSIGAGDFTGEAFRDVLEKGGFFRHSKSWTETAGLSEDLGRFLDDASTAIFTQAKKFGEALGLPAQELSMITTQVRVTLTDDVEKNKTEIAKALGSYGDALIAGWADEVEPLKQYGETVAQTINRVGGAIVDVNAVLESLGVKALQASVAGGQAALQLEGFFGGIQNLGSAAGNYVGKFYTEAERVDLQTQAITKTLGAVGLQLPATRDAFRDLVEAQDLSTESGRRAFTALLASADAFDFVATSAEQAAQKLKQEADARAQSAQQLIDQNIGKFFGAADVQRYRYGQVAQSLAGVGLNFSTEQLMGASKADILAFVQSVVQLGDGASEAELAVLKAAGALADLKDEATTAAQAANQAVAQHQAELQAAFQAAQQDALAGVVAAYSQVQQQIEGERQRIQTETDQAIQAAGQKADAGIRQLETQASNIERIFGGMLDSFGDGIARLTGDLAGDGGRGGALRTLRAGLAALQTGGTVDADALRSASGLASQVDPAAFRSRLDYQREIAGTVNLLRDLSGAARGSMTTQLGAIAAQQVYLEKGLADQTKALKDTAAGQLSKLDEQLRAARGQAESLVRIDGGVQSVAQALAALAQAVSAAGALQGKPSQVTGQWQQSGSTQVWQSSAGAVGTLPVGSTDITQLIIKGKQSTFNAGEARTWITSMLIDGREGDVIMRAIAEGIDSQSLDALTERPAGTWLAEAKKRGLPAFATGTAYVPQTGVALIHEGERILPAADNAALMRALTDSNGSGRDDLLAEVQGLRRAVEAMAEFERMALPPLVVNTRKTEQSLDAIIFGKVPIRTKVVTTD